MKSKQPAKRTEKTVAKKVATKESKQTRLVPVSDEQIFTVPKALLPLMKLLLKLPREQKIEIATLLLALDSRWTVTRYKK